MSALDDAAQAVEEARERLIGWTLVALPNEPGFAGAERRADALIAAVRHHDAETVRDLSRQGYSAQEAAKKIDPSPQADLYPEAEVRFAGGPTIRVARFDVTTDATTGLVEVEGFITTPAVRPPSGDAVHIAYLGIPGRGALADVTASVELFTRLEVLNIRIRLTLTPTA